MGQVTRPAAGRKAGYECAAQLFHDDGHVYVAVMVPRKWSQIVVNDPATCGVTVTSMLWPGVSSSSLSGRM